MVEKKVREHENRFDKFAGFKFVVELKVIEHDKNQVKVPVNKIESSNPEFVAPLSLCGVCVNVYVARHKA